MKKLILLNLIVFGSFSITKAQVGIGNAVPDATSTLDLTNSSNKGLLLPMPASISSMSNTTSMLYFYDNNIYYRRSDGYNAISPWKYKFNGNLSSNIYYNLGGNIGIGLSDITVSPLAPLQIETDKPLNLVDDGSFLIGTTTKKSLAFNSYQIQSRDTGSASDLYINKQGGDVQIGSDRVPANVKVSEKVQELHQPTGQYFDLVPTGTIVMWYGSTSNIPTGWAMCDGNNYARSDNNDSILTPDLSGRFIVGAGHNGETGYSPQDTGGEDKVVMTEAEMPKHRHAASTSEEGAHTHTIKGVEGGDIAGSSGNGDASIKNNDGKVSYYEDTKSSGAHKHEFDTEFTGTSSAQENRPKYYALVYIIKL